LPFLTVVLIAFGLSLVLTRVFIGWVEARDIAAAENHRTMHKGRVATGGGLPLLVAMLSGAAAFWPFGSETPYLLPALAVLAAVSWADDIMTVPPLLRLAAHVAAAVAALASFPSHLLVFQGTLPFWLDRAVAGLALVWFINLYNFMDGIDGIAGTETVAIALGYVAVLAAAGLTGAPLVTLALAAAGATAGFLVWNWHPARIFMGDVGAVPLGFLMGWLMLDLAARVSLAAAFILPLYFVADATITLGQRLWSGAKPWDAHREHFYQRATRGLGSHARTVKRVALINIALIMCAVLGTASPWPGFALATAAVAALLVNLEAAARGKKP
jgi:UDP-N-acetylmuramyl pentapeptide phosphotransferase/UDP-N-acetylglucosamine-1-phosphate transferase